MDTERLGTAGQTQALLLLTLMAIESLQHFTEVTNKLNGWQKN